MRAIVLALALLVSSLAADAGIGAKLGLASIGTVFAPAEAAQDAAGMTGTEAEAAGTAAAAVAARKTAEPIAAADASAGPKAEAAPADRPISVNLVGDILLASGVDANIRKYGIDFPFKRTADALSDADLTFGNLETSVSARGKPQDKQFTFRSRPETLQALVDAGFDGVTIANNHTMDYGLAALQDTVSNLDRYKLGHAGAGDNQAEAFAPYVKDVRGRKVAIVGISRVLPNGSWYAGKDKAGIASGYSLEPMLTYVKQAAAKSDYTIVYIHWNKEREDYPEDYARKYARALVDAGADAVVGAHSHCLQGIEWYKGKPVFYSLGNFVFTASSAAKSSVTMIAQLGFGSDGEVTARVVPAKIVNTQPRLMDAAFNKTTIAKLNQISFNAKVLPDGAVVEKQ